MASASSIAGIHSALRLLPKRGVFQGLILLETRFHGLGIDTIGWGLHLEVTSRPQLVLKWYINFTVLGEFYESLSDKDHSPRFFLVSCRSVRNHLATSVGTKN